MTTAPATGTPPFADRATSPSPLLPVSSMSYGTGEVPTTTVVACGWWPSADAISTYVPSPGASAR
ncbi:hypothetical protein [Streptomyces sp. NPDC052015]|uniref:hypothetical protein n=1 Tax=Streptomyces sp. NPDC052015 TaxID=3154755 RepID=UPI0034132963